MRRCRVRVAKSLLSESDVPDIGQDSLNFFLKVINVSEVVTPSWASYSMMSYHPGSEVFELYYFEEHVDFVSRYGKSVLIFGDTDSSFYCYKKDPAGNWTNYNPPTLIGLDLKTKLW